MKLKFNNIPVDWKDGLLFGNGRLNGIVWGNPQKDLVSLNHEHLWTGKHGNRRNRVGHDYLTQIRKLLKENDYFRATALASLAFSGNGGISPYPRQEDAYKPAGELVFQYNQEQSDNMIRTLDIQKGIATVKRDKIQLESFADCVTGVLITSWKSSETFNGTLSYERIEEDDVLEKIYISAEGITYQCTLDEVSQFKVVVKVNTNGCITFNQKEMYIQDATYIETMTNIGVSFNDIEKELTAFPFPSETIGNIKEEHIKKFSTAMSKTDIRITDKETRSLSAYFINERIESVRNGKTDVNLMEIYAKFGMYLMVAGAICGELPLNLQGKWNCDPVPAWFCDYHFNINVQMNYWFTEQLDIPQYNKPLFDYVERFAESGKTAAKDLYGCHGTWLSLNGDQWAISTPEAYNYAAWIGGAAWMGQHYWWHYQYNGDMTFLKDVAYPFFKATVDFYVDYIEIDEDNVAQIMPSQSPENRFEGTGYFPVSICRSSAMDVQLAYDAFSYAIETAKILGSDAKERLVWEELRGQLPAFKIAQNGRLLEWDDENKKEVEKGHRHYSHLYGLFPSTLFNPIKRKEQYEASRKSLEYRLAQNGGGTGWSRAWAACLFARLQDGEGADHQLSYLLTELSSSTLLDLHPRPVNCKVRDDATAFVFQVDGNMGATRAVIECMIQCYEGKIFLLPALPKSWKKGGIKGVKTIGGHTVDLSYEHGQIVALTITMGFTETAIIDNHNRLLEGDTDIVLEGKKGSVITLL